MTLVRDRAYVEGMRDGCAIGRCEALWLVALGASWSAQIYTWHYCHWVRQKEEACAWTFDVRARVARDIADATVRVLADLGDTRAQEILRGER
jgi:hypothetical protein